MNTDVKKKKCISKYLSIAGAVTVCAVAFFFVIPYFGPAPYLPLVKGGVLAAVAIAFYFVFRYVYLPLRDIEKKGLSTEEVKRSKHISYAYEALRLDSLKELSEREYAALIYKKQAELDSLQSQINPHFLYNTLESIRGQAVLDRADKIAKMTEALSAFFRYSIGRKGSIVQLTDELKNTDNYMLIQQFRFGEKISLQKIIPDGEEALQGYLPKMTVQPIIENAIYHGLEMKEGKGRIILRVTLTGDRMLINVTDNGIGMEDEQVEKINASMDEPIHLSTGQDQNRKGKGIALKNVNDRIRLLYGEEYGIRVFSTLGEGTDVELRLPFKKDKPREQTFLQNPEDK